MTQLIRSLLTVVLIAVTSTTATANESASYAPAASASAPAAKPVATKSPRRSKFPQHAIQFIGFDGTTYIYASKCCEADNHRGLLYSATEIKKLGCSTTGVGGDLDIDIKPETGKGSLNVTLPNLGLDQNCGQIKNASWLSSDQPFRDYYGGGNDMTSIHLKAQDGSSRYFTVVKSRIKLENTDYQIPMLILSRRTANFNRGGDDGGLAVNINPTRRLNDGAGQNVDLRNWQTSGIFKLKLQLPVGNDDSQTEAVDCIVVHRS